MAVNPMQRQKRNSFLLGMLVTILVAAVVIVLLYLRITNLQKEVDKYSNPVSVYALNQDVESGQVLTADMFKLITVPSQIMASIRPSDATIDIMTTLNSHELSTTDGDIIYMEKAQNETWSYFILGDDEQKLILEDNNGNAVTHIEAGDKLYYKVGSAQRVEVTVSTNVPIAKVDLKANTIITTSLIAIGDEITTNDLRKVEYNVISLPIDLMSDEFIDIRLMLPNGEDYIVLSKKRINVPMANGVYLADTIQMNLTESEILLLSSAIIDSYQVEGSKLYATKYVEAGLQEKATVTYAPSNEIRTLIQTDPNAVDKAVTSLRERINNAMRDHLNADNVSSNIEQSAASTLEARRSYLQSLAGY